MAASCRFPGCQPGDPPIPDCCPEAEGREGVASMAWHCRFCGASFAAEDHAAHEATCPKGRPSQEPQAPPATRVHQAEDAEGAIALARDLDALGHISGRRAAQIVESYGHPAAVWRIGQRVRDWAGRVGTVTHTRIMTPEHPDHPLSIKPYQRIEMAPDPGQGCTLAEAASWQFTAEGEAPEAAE